MHFLLVSSDEMRVERWSECVFYIELHMWSYYAILFSSFRLVWVSALCISSHLEQFVTFFSAENINPRLFMLHIFRKIFKFAVGCMQDWYIVSSCLEEAKGNEDGTKFLASWNLHLHWLCTPTPTTTTSPRVLLTSLIKHLPFHQVL